MFFEKRIGVKNKMNIKIKLPNPSELDFTDWIDQMELSLFHAKKAYEKFRKSIDEDKQEDILFYLSYPEMMKNKEFEKLLNDEKIEYNDSQDIEIVISY
jgi:hypothetical protein